MKNILLYACLLLIFFVNAQDRVNGKLFATRSEVIAQHGMVATSHPLATQVGLDILQRRHPGDLPRARYKSVWAGFDRDSFRR